MSAFVPFPNLTLNPNLKLFSPKKIEIRIKSKMNAYSRLDFSSVCWRVAR